jgi:hypothetical protein
VAVKRVFIRTDAAGAYSWERSFRGVIDAIEVQIGDLSTPDIDITDETYSLSFLSVNGLAADTVYFPGEFLQDNAGVDLAAGTSIKAGTPAVCMGSLKIAVTGGGDTKRGEVIILYH